MDDVPSDADVDAGTHLVWGNDRVYGLFPTAALDDGPGKTYMLRCDPYAEEDSMWDDPDSVEAMAGVALGRTGLTYQWKEQPVVYATGRHQELSLMRRYFANADTWSKFDTLDSVAFGLGACIAYAPNKNFNEWSNAVPGWIYCLAGGGKSFWRYHIPAVNTPDIALYGYYPGPGAIIADQTPPFQWGTTATPQYRIQVSPNPYFMSNVIDEIVSSPGYEPPTKLSNGGYYWRTAAWVNSAWSWSGNRNFDLDGGWERRDSIGTDAGLGAEIAYDDTTFGHAAILALYGRNDKCFSEYNINQNTWTDLDQTPESIFTGTSLITNAAIIAEVGGVRHIDAVFCGQPEGSHPWYYDINRSQGYRWDEFSDETGNDTLNPHLPDDIDVGSSFVIGAAHWMYGTTGHARRFYGVDPSIALGEGQQARVTLSGRAKAQVIASRDGIRVEYQLSTASHVRATLHDAIGRQVDALDLGEQKPGLHRLSWDRDREGRRLSAGAYFVQLDTGTEKARLKAVVR